MNTAQITAPATATAAQSILGTTTKQISQSGGFMAILDNMLAGTFTGLGGALTGLVNPQAGQEPMGDGTSPEEQKAMEMAAQLQAAMLMQGQLQVTDIPQPQVQAEEIVSTVQQFQGNLQSMATLMQSSAQTVTDQAQQINADQAMAENPPVQQKNGEAPKTAELTFAGLVRLTDQKTEGKSNATELIATVGTDKTMTFEQAVQRAQQKMSGGDSETENDNSEKQNGKKSIDELQKLVDSGKYLENTGYTAQSTAYEPMNAKLHTAPTVAQQTFEGITKGLADGAEEFTVKLKPEGLGEITVKLTQGAEGRMSISIMASNDSTAKLLGTEMASLRATLTAAGTQLENIHVESTQQSGGYLAQDQNAQSFLNRESSMQQQRQQNQRQRNTIGLMNIEENSNIIDMAQLRAQSMGLDMFI